MVQDGVNCRVFTVVPHHSLFCLLCFLCCVYCINSETIDLLFQPVADCPLPDNSIPGGYASCEEYWEGTANYMKQESFRVAGYWAILFFGSVLGNLITFFGFGTASERLNKRVRDSSFLALLRQEVGFFDRRSVGALTSQLEDDAARIHAFSGEPIRSFIIAMSSIVVGLVLSLSVRLF